MMSCPCNKYEQIMHSYLLSVEDKAINVTKNLVQLMKNHLVPQGELLKF